MLELAVLGSFCACLMALVALGAPVLVPLAIGFLLFCGYGIARGHSVRDVLGMALDGISGARGVLESFVLIGILTALWRAAGTISEVVLLATPFVTPAMAPARGLSAHGRHVVSHGHGVWHGRHDGRRVHDDRHFDGVPARCCAAAPCSRDPTLATAARR